jgi:hypothetical protein
MRMKTKAARFTLHRKGRRPCLRCIGRRLARFGMFRKRKTVRFALKRRRLGLQCLGKEGFPCIRREKRPGLWCMAARFATYWKRKAARIAMLEKRKAARFSIQQERMSARCAMCKKGKGQVCNIWEEKGGQVCNAQEEEGC